VTAYGVWGFLILSLGFEGLLTPFETGVVLLLAYIFLTILIIFLVLFFGNANRLSQGIELLGKPLLRYSSLEKLYAAIERWLRNFADNFQYILQMPRSEKFIMLALVFSQNFIKWFSVYLIFLAVVDLPFWIVMVSSVLGGFVNLVPIAIPGLVGLREIVGQWSIDIFLQDPNLALIASIIQSLGLWIFFALAGLVSIPYFLLFKRQPPTTTTEEVSTVNET